MVKDDKEIRSLIKKDVERTMQEYLIFREKEIQHRL
jgi:hypothetical protein